ncbi:MAG: pyruvate dehydrogenase E1 component [Candidatus Poribacteria bacterium]|nr:MAG: pyruvate dehydrogenase E1 component [Candidatus Poribacteria bacterium]
MKERPRRTRIEDGLEAVEDLLAFILQQEDEMQASFLLTELADGLRKEGLHIPFTMNTPYVNTIPPEEEPPYPGDRELERKIKSYVRWNAMAMVVQANREHHGIGGHISTYMSVATLYEVGFNHFWRAPNGDFPGDFVYFQGHSSPGVYARAFLEGRLTEAHLHHFRQELGEGDGLPSYPHPYLMPDFWQFPTVSMGLGPIMSIYQARFIRYLENRGLLDPAHEPKVWCFVGDGEVDEPETLGAITLASREKLDNLIWVVNCNLQRLDGPVRGNGKIIQELESTFRGAGWNVIKVIWGSNWDPLLAQDEKGLLRRRMAECVDGEYQKYSVEHGSYVRQHFFGKYPELLELVRHMTDEEIQRLRRGGHDPQKVYAAYHAAVNHRGTPTVILAKTIKGYGLGEAGEGRNITHQQKELNERELREFRDRFNIPISDEEVVKAPFYRPPEDSPEMIYLHQRRQALGGYLPQRRVLVKPLDLPGEALYAEFARGSQAAVSTTMSFVRLLAKLMRDKAIGKRVVPIIPDEARTFGMDALFREFGIYSSVGQLYEPVDSEHLLYYKEAKDGQILEEGITEAGSMSSFIAAGTAYANLGIPMIPFFIFYSMFGLQRVGDLVWAAADSRARGFLMAATAGRTTLNGEGLQHQDGHSHLIASAIPTLQPYDPAYAYEIAVIIRDGLRRMFQQNEDIFYYITLYNENYPMPPMPEGVEEGILRGLYRFRPAEGSGRFRAQIFGSGPLLNEALRAQELLAERFGVAADVWSATSYTLLRREALQCDRWNRLHPTEPPRRSYLETVLEGVEGPFVAVSDYVSTVAHQIAPWVPGLIALGTDGFGRSETRPKLRRLFEVDAESIAIAVLEGLRRQGKLDAETVARAIRELDVDPDKYHPMLG